MNHSLQDWVSRQGEQNPNQRRISRHYFRLAAINRQNSRPRGKSFPPRRSAIGPSVRWWLLSPRRFCDPHRWRWSNKIKDVSAKFCVDMGLCCGNLCTGCHSPGLRSVSGLGPREHTCSCPIFRSRLEFAQFVGGDVC